MQRKKHRAKVAQEIRNKFKLSFNESQKMARLLSNGDTYGAMTLGGFRSEAEWTTNLGDRGPTGNALWIKNIGGFFSRDELIIRGIDLSDYSYQSKRYSKKERNIS